MYLGVCLLGLEPYTDTIDMYRLILSFLPANRMANLSILFANGGRTGGDFCFHFLIKNISFPLINKMFPPIFSLYRLS